MINCTIIYLWLFTWFGMYLHLINVCILFYCIPFLKHCSSIYLTYSKSTSICYRRFMVIVIITIIITNVFIMITIIIIITMVNFITILILIINFYIIINRIITKIIVIITRIKNKILSMYFFFTLFQISLHIRCKQNIKITLLTRPSLFQYYNR